MIFIIKLGVLDMTYDDLRRGLDIFEQYLDEDLFISDYGIECIKFGKDNGKIPNEVLVELDELGFFIDEEGVWYHFV